MLLYQEELVQYRLMYRPDIDQGAMCYHSKKSSYQKGSIDFDYNEDTGEWEINERDTELMGGYKLTEYRFNFLKKFFLDFMAKTDYFQIYTQQFQAE